jgi:hypothetical protein
MLLVLTAALIMGACGGSSSEQSSGDAEGTLIAALLKLQNGPSTVTLTLRSDPQSLQALSARGGEDGLLGKDSDTILSSSVTVSHNGATNPRDKRSAMTINIGGDKGAIETRMVNRTLYLRADASGLAKSFGKTDADLQRLAREAKATGMAFMKPALEGKWLSFAGLDKLAAQSGASLPSSSKNKEATDAFAQRLLGVARVSTVGDEAAGTHLEIGIPARAGYAALRDAITNVGSLPPGASLPEPATIPDRDIKVDAWVKDGALTQIELDLRQLAALGDEPLPDGVHLLAFRMTFRDFSGTIEAPSGAVPVDLKELAKIFATHHASASASSGAGPATVMPNSSFTDMNCSALKGIPPKEIRSLLSGSPARLTALARHCPTLHLQT